MHILSKLPYFNKFYSCRKNELNVGDYTKDVPSIQALLDRTGKSIPEILSGDQSLGAMFENEGHKSIPSSRQPTPGRANFLHFESKTKLGFAAKIR